MSRRYGGASHRDNLEKQLADLQGGGTILPTVTGQAAGKVLEIDPSQPGGYAWKEKSSGVIPTADPATEEDFVLKAVEVDGVLQPTWAVDLQGGGGGGATTAAALTDFPAFTQTNVQGKVLKVSNLNALEWATDAQVTTAPALSDFPDYANSGSTSYLGRSLSVRDAQSGDHTFSGDPANPGQALFWSNDRGSITDLDDTPSLFQGTLPGGSTNYDFDGKFLKVSIPASGATLAAPNPLNGGVVFESIAQADVPGVPNHLVPAYTLTTTTYSDGTTHTGDDDDGKLLTVKWKANQNMYETKWRNPSQFMTLGQMSDVEPLVSYADASGSSTINPENKVLTVKQSNPGSTPATYHALWETTSVLSNEHITEQLNSGASFNPKRYKGDVYLRANGEGSVIIGPTDISGTETDASGNEYVRSGYARTGGRLSLLCDNGNHAVTIAAPPHSVNSASYTLTLPEALPTTALNNLQVNSSGELSFQAAATTQSGGATAQSSGAGYHRGYPFPFGPGWYPGQGTSPPTHDQALAANGWYTTGAGGTWSSERDRAGTGSEFGVSNWNEHGSTGTANSDVYSAVRWPVSTHLKNRGVGPIKGDLHLAAVMHPEPSGHAQGSHAWFGGCRDAYATTTGSDLSSATNAPLSNYMHYVNNWNCQEVDGLVQRTGERKITYSGPNAAPDWQSTKLYTGPTLVNMYGTDDTYTSGTAFNMPTGQDAWTVEFCVRFPAGWVHAEMIFLDWGGNFRAYNATTNPLGYTATNKVPAIALRHNSAGTFFVEGWDSNNNQGSRYVSGMNPFTINSNNFATNPSSALAPNPWYSSEWWTLRFTKAQGAGNTLVKCYVAKGANDVTPQWSTGNWNSAHQESDFGELTFANNLNHLSILHANNVETGNWNSDPYAAQIKGIKIWRSEVAPGTGSVTNATQIPNTANPYVDAGLHTTMSGNARGGAVGLTLVGGAASNRGAYITVDPYVRPLSSSVGVDYSIDRTDEAGASLANRVHNGAVEKIKTINGDLSDDRFKHSEVAVNDDDAVRWVKQVPVRKYTKRMVMMQPKPADAPSDYLSEEERFEQGIDGFGCRADRDDPWASQLYDKSFEEIGVIAQDLHQTDLAYAVEVGDENTEWRVRYENLTCLNTKVIQTLLARIEALEAAAA